MYKNKKLLFWFSIFCILTMVGLRIIWFQYHSQDALDVSVHDGVIQIENSQDIEGKYIPLTGDWLFYPNQFIDPNTSANEHKQSLTIPGNWKDDLESENEATAYGKGSYQLYVQLPHDFNKELALRFNEIFSAATIYINGTLVHEFNNIDHDFNDRGFIRGPVQVEIPATEEQTINLVIHVSNYQFPIQGGLTRPIHLGEKDVIQRQFYFQETIQMIISFTFLLHAIYGLIIFLFIKNKRKEFLFFSLMLILFGAGILIDDEVVIQLPLSISESQRLLLFIFISTLFVMFKLCCNIFNIYFKNKLNPNYFYMLIAFLTFALPYTNYQYWVYTLYAVFFFIIIFMLYQSIKNIRNGNTNGYFILLFISAYASNAVWGALIKSNIVPMPFYPLDYLFSMLFVMMLFFKQHAETLEENKKHISDIMENEKKKDEFLANTAHELRNPLHSMIVIIETIVSANDQQLTQKVKNDLYLTLEVAYNMKYTLNDLQDISRLKEHEIKLNVKNVNLNQLSNNIVDVFRLFTEGKSIKIENDIPKEFPLLSGDEQRLFQILFNLVNNAIKYTKEGAITLKATTKDEQAIIQIIDTGIGIPPDEIDLIFNPYKRGSNVNTFGNYGVGLGLNISKELIQLHGGNIKIESEIKKGTVISFTVPLSKQPKGEIIIDEFPLTMPPKSKLDHQHLDRSTKTKKKIIVIDDDPINLKALKIALSDRYDLTIFSNPEDVFTLDHLYDYSLVISDIMMPQMSGYELTKELRKHFSITDLPILLLTALNHPSNISTGFLAGANDYIHKPVERNELISRVETLVHLKQAIQEKIATEAAWLQAQIKPHFVLNTLNSIASLGLSHTDKMIELIHEFGNYLSKSFDINSTNQLVSIGHEVNIVKSYVHIQSTRFPNRFEVRWQMDLSDHLFIPPFVLQTLVENSIQHGALQTPASKGLIDISIKINNDMAQISVKDNGPGMNREQIQNILYNHKSNGIGLYNTNKRLKIVNQKGLDIIPCSPHGTEVKFELPIRKNS